MAQRDKVKELVGRGLNSYHTKALQQVDRIEKKNKEQNHKISILSNELDNDYLTKTEEGSVISLEHSKEGMVYLDELQGNTLVNYCTDGSKEMTLNGDIDVEGTFVTTTEGVDGGKIDVMCEGNTLVNLNKRFNSTQTSSWDATNSDYVVSVEGHTVAGGVLWYYTYLKPSTTYTMVVNILECANMENILLDSHYSYPPANTITLKKEVGVQKIVFNTKDSFEQVGISIKIATYGKDTTNKLKISKHMLLLEGDWTNKEIPQYFEGMKSVGECEDNKIEILSQNKNLVSELEVGGLNSSDGAENGNNGVFTIRNKGYIKVEPNTTYTLSIEDNNTFEGMVFHTYDINKKQIGYNPSSKFTLTTPNNAYYLRFRSFNADATNVNTNLKIQLEKGNIRTSYVRHSINKKEILLNEPLRSVPNGTKDKMVKINNKWYIERKCGCVILDENVDWGAKETFDTVNRYRYTLPNANAIHISKNAISDKYITTTDDVSFEHLRVSNGWVWYYNTQDLTYEEVKSIFTNKPTKLVYQLATPIYEEIIDPTLITYLDTTHISNNSTIPCNMVVKNSGYSTIIKPSTQYTVALDTNKSGEVGINLGGAKVTTTNNVATITTPSTLTDDSLRLYGKGIKGSKVRLFEGDKTNWIPSFFEGMKSSFEDKLQDDGTYKMEILSKDGNLIDIEYQALVNKASGMTCDFITYKDLPCWQIRTQAYTEYYNYFRCNYEPNTQYSLSFDCEMIYYNHDGTGVGMSILYTDGTVQRTGHINKDTKRVEVTTLPNKTVQCIKFQGWGYNGTVNMYNMQLIKGNTPKATMEKSNKIQFSSIEPLKGLPNGVKDRFLFKDNKLMIERNTKKIFLNNQTISSVITYDIAHNGTMLPFSFKLKNSDCKKGAYIEVPCNKFATSSNSYRGFPTTCIQQYIDTSACFVGSIHITNLKSKSSSAILEYFNDNNIEVTYQLAEPTYEEIPFELQKIILEGYENGTLFFDTNIPPTSTVTYAGETPIVKSVRLNKTEVLSNTEDINDNIIPYLMDMDYRVVMLQLATEELEGGVSMARLFGGTYEMIKRDILSKRLSRQEYGYRLADYFNAGKLTEEQVRELEELR